MTQRCVQLREDGGSVGVEGGGLRAGDKCKKFDMTLYGSCGNADHWIFYGWEQVLDIAMVGSRDGCTTDGVKC
jgi:hypothetical protein